MNLNDFSKWLQYNRVKNLRGSEYFPYPLYIWVLNCYIGEKNKMVIYCFAKTILNYADIMLQVFCDANMH